MLTRFLKNKEPLLSTIVLLQLSEEFKLNPQEWDIIDHSINALTVFNAVTEEISSEKTVSASKIIVLTKFHSRHVNSSLEGKNLPEEVKNMCRELKQELNRRFSNIESNELLSQCVLLDPRFKRKGFISEKFQPTKAAIEKKIAGLTSQQIKTGLSKKRQITIENQKNAGNILLICGKISGKMLSQRMPVRQQ
ncbi:hypothetical protein AVEN_118796-1 [Araneus ventricosus]|uniref:Zinc finger BED domain-containing protein 4 n=1 Tax=Araneus ventricosus TaxID=182803 RepID=A0A4Y2BXH3_ARAVE|nr:hypothetical protein AVEN_118796-1 [Araneus ventricosus]